jgi:hypothetical protein
VIQNLNDFSDHILGKSREPATVDTSVGNRAAVLSMLRQTRHTIDIFSRELDTPIYDNGDVVAAVRAVVVGSSRARVRILVSDTARVVAHGHRLLNLAYRLSTFIEIRKVAHEHRTYNTALFIADNTGTVVRRFADRFDAEVCFYNLKQARELTRTFNQMWAIAKPDPNLRAVHL